MSLFEGKEGFAAHIQALCRLPNYADRRTSEAVERLF
jgi:hypothetical protein